jgi:hypothetical protein
MKYQYLILLMLLFQGCAPKLQGTFEGEVEDWLLDSRGEYPVDYYRFKRGNRFEYRVIFCMLTIRGSGRYRIEKDSILLKYKPLNEPEVDDLWELSDTLIQMPFQRLNDSTVLMDGVRFRRIWR